MIDFIQNWVKMLPWAEYAYDTSFHSRKHETPFEIAYERSPPSISNYVRGSSKLEVVDKDLQERNKALKQLKENLASG